MVKLILSHLWCLDWWSYGTVLIHLSSVLIHTVWASSGGGSHLSGIGSQTPPLFTRGIIQHMAAACLWCQIAHKEWFCCLLGEMVTNWCCGLSAIKGRSTYRNEALFRIQTTLFCCADPSEQHVIHGKWAQHGEDSVATLFNGIKRWFLSVVAITLTQSLKLNKCCFPLESSVLFAFICLAQSNKKILTLCHKPWI